MKNRKLTLDIDTTEALAKVRALKAEIDDVYAHWVDVSGRIDEGRDRDDESVFREMGACRYEWDTTDDTTTINQHGETTMTARRSVWTVTVASLDTTGADIAGFAAADTGAWCVTASVVNQDASDVLLVSLDGGTTYPYKVAAGATQDLPLSCGPVLLGGVGENPLHWKAATNTCDNALLVYTAVVEAA